ncbi:MAG TPA: glycosyltransferase [Gemmatimonadaceae bacterium]|nr:glycosyltransferase [Gemmatimonadaceae bacterium]
MDNPEIPATPIGPQGGKPAGPRNGRRPIRVIAWPAFANRVENPYNSLLYSALRDEGIEVAEFSVQRLLLGRQADILHLHWSPTTRIRGATRGRVKRTSAEMLLLLAAAKRRGMKIVWTAHNIGAHDRLEYPDLEAKYWPRVASSLSALISLSLSGVEVLRSRYPSLNTVPSFVTPHGHYRTAYPRTLSRAEARKQLGISQDAKVISFVGQVRPYKNLPALVRAFRSLSDPSAVLLIAGKVKLGDKRQKFDDLVAADSRIKVFGTFVPPDEMQLYLEAADLVVLPFRETLNSGSAILALSFDKPVLVPRAGSLVDLSQQIGENWVMTYEGELTPAILKDAVDRAVTMRESVAPLDPLEWSLIARQTRDIYRSLVER